MKQTRGKVQQPFHGSTPNKLNEPDFKNILNIFERGDNVNITNCNFQTSGVLVMSSQMQTSLLKLAFQSDHINKKTLKNLKNKRNAPNHNLLVLCNTANFGINLLPSKYRACIANRQLM